MQSCHDTPEPLIQSHKIAVFDCHRLSKTREDDRPVSFLPSGGIEGLLQVGTPDRPVRPRLLTFDTA
ncbi:hypothetical protein CCP4SC76_7350011 [Gammaproteobacteria bacterium]